MFSSDSSGQRSDYSRGSVGEAYNFSADTHESRAYGSTGNGSDYGIGRDFTGNSCDRSAADHFMSTGESRLGSHSHSHSTQPFADRVHQLGERSFAPLDHFMDKEQPDSSKGTKDNKRSMTIHGLFLKGFTPVSFGSIFDRVANFGKNFWDNLDQVNRTLGWSSAEKFIGEKFPAAKIYLATTLLINDVISTENRHESLALKTGVDPEIAKQCAKGAAIVEVGLKEAGTHVVISTAGEMGKASSAYLTPCLTPGGVLGTCQAGTVRAALGYAGTAAFVFFGLDSVTTFSESAAEKVRTDCINKATQQSAPVKDIVIVQGISLNQFQTDPEKINGKTAIRTIPEFHEHFHNQAAESKNGSSFSPNTARSEAYPSVNPAVPVTPPKVDKPVQQPVVHKSSHTSIITKIANKIEESKQAAVVPIPKVVPLQPVISTPNVTKAVPNFFSKTGKPAITVSTQQASIALRRIMRHGRT